MSLWRVAQLVLSGFRLDAPSFFPVQTTQIGSVGKPSKRIAIVGGGTGGVTALKTLLVDLPEEERSRWEVVLYEQKRDVGGVW